MIALTLKDDLDNVLEVSVQPNMDDDNKSSLVFQLQSENNENSELWNVFYYINDKEQLNALISKLISAKKQLPD